ncbi:UNVERIFIED_CONTAM: Aluminum-activated malate transporter 8 [Sesamum latifolium]|uniref:Aluminum-activated malate transporter 8 n=1 Tax=Sesamum latifolium TaxID=2727402 RepID=A0AAW2U3D7_9LAMI
MWAVLTVVVVFEFTVGGTLSKCLNRGSATLLAGALGVGAEHIARLCGEKGEPVVLGLFVFILAATSTFMRFFPNVKKRYEYGMLIFILTFTLVAVSGARVTHILQMAHQRLSTILIGGATCIAISIFICPVWAGQDLHNLVAANIENLAVFFQGFGVEFCSCPGEECSTVSSKDDKDCRSYLQSYKKILNSKANEESLVASEFQPTITKMSTESGKALQELASAVKNMTFPLSTVEIHIRNSKDAASDLRSILENPSFPSKNMDLQEIMPVLVVAYVLTDIINCVEKLSVHVHELGKKAGFRYIKVTN